MVVGLFNPKAIVFFVAVFPHFVDPAAGQVTLQLFVLGVLFSVIALVSDGAWGLGAGSARDRLLGAPRLLVGLRTDRRGRHARARLAHHRDRGRVSGGLTARIRRRSDCPMMARPSKHQPGTQAIHADDAARGGAVVAPIVQATTFAQPTDAEFVDAATRSFSDDFYVRYGTPNHTQVAEVVAALEGADRAMVTAGGMGAISTLALALLKAGDHVVAQRSIYPGTTALVGTVLERFGVTSSTVDLRDLDALEGALRDETALVLVETPSNPFLGIVDVAAVAHLAHRRGALVVVDNTLATPINQRPLELGADLVWHSATKYLGGHSDVSAGVVAGHTDVIEEIWRTHLVVGSVLGPFDAWLLLRGLRTLDVRVARHNENALALAAALEAHEAVTRGLLPRARLAPPARSSRRPRCAGSAGCSPSRSRAAPRRRTGSSTGSACPRGRRASGRSTPSGRGPRRCGGTRATTTPPSPTTSHRGSCASRSASSRPSTSWTTSPPPSTRSTTSPTPVARPDDPSALIAGRVAGGDGDRVATGHSSRAPRRRRLSRRCIGAPARTKVGASSAVAPSTGAMRARRLQRPARPGPARRARWPTSPRAGGRRRPRGRTPARPSRCPSRASRRGR